MLFYWAQGHSRKHISAVRELLNDRIVRTIIVPEGIDDYEKDLLLDFKEMLEPYNVKLLYYSRGCETTIHIGSTAIQLPAYTTIKRSVHPINAMNFVTDEGKISYCCGSAWENEYIWKFVGGTGELIIGQHGPLYKMPPESFPENTIVYVNEGHPLASAFAGHPNVRQTAKNVQTYILVP